MEIASSIGEEDLPRPEPFPGEVVAELLPIDELDLERFFTNFPAFTKRAIALTKRGSSGDLDVTNPAVINRKVTKRLGIVVDTRVGELSALSGQHAACEYPNVDLAALRGVPHVSTVLQHGLSRDVQGARW
jgi:hypothetical protein